MTSLETKWGGGVGGGKGSYQVAKDKSQVSGAPESSTSQRLSTVLESDSLGNLCSVSLLAVCLRTSDLTSLFFDFPIYKWAQ